MNFTQGDGESEAQLDPRAWLASPRVMPSGDGVVGRPLGSRLWTQEWGLWGHQKALWYLKPSSPWQIVIYPRSFQPPRPALSLPRQMLRLVQPLMALTHPEPHLLSQVGTHAP